MILATVTITVEIPDHVNDDATLDAALEAFEAKMLAVVIPELSSTPELVGFPIRYTTGGDDD